MSLLSSALAYAENGWQVFPLRPGAKVPMGGNGHLDATVDEATIRDWWTRNPDSNIGIACGSVSGITIIDVDGPQGIASSKQVKGVPATRMIKTPHGFHLYFMYNEGFHTGANFLPGLDVRNDGGYVVAPPSVVDEQPYTVLRDEVLAELILVPEVFQQTHRNGHGNTPNADQPTWVSQALAGVSQGSRDETATRLAGYFHSKGLPQDVILELMKPFGERCQPPYAERDLLKTIASIGRYAVDERPLMAEDENGPPSITAVIGDWIKHTQGWWTADELDRDLGLNTVQDRKNRSQVLRRMRTDGHIEGHTTINKRFRRVEEYVAGLDFKAAPTGAVLDLSWPMQLEDYVHLYPGNIAVIAGNSNAGKTAFMLNFIWLNQGKCDINYWCSEMEAEELGDRLDGFGVSRDSWKFRAFDRATDFHDVVVADSINLIDYLDLDDNVYLVKSHLDKISRAIGKGMALVALQKKGGNELGYGQERSLATPKLYLSMAAGKLKIVKAKVPAKHNVTANGLCRTFQIRNGVYFVPDANDNGWEYERT